MAEVVSTSLEPFSQAVLDSMNQHIAVIDHTGTILIVNAAWRQFARANGLESDAALQAVGIGVNYLEVCRASALQGWEEASAAYGGICSILSGERGTFTMEYPCHGPHEQGWFLMTVSPLTAPPGGAVIIHTDITARRLAEIALAEREMQLAGIVETAMDAIITVNHDQQIVGWNAAAARMFGCGAADAIGQPLTTFIPARYHRSHHRAMRAFGKTGDTPRAMGNFRPLSARRADGSEFPIEASISRFFVNSELLFTAILRDISARQAAAAQLLASEARFQAIIEHSAEGVVLMGADRRPLYISPNIVPILGYSADEFMEMPPDRTTHPDDFPALQKFRDFIYSTPGATGQINVRVRHKDGRWRWIERSLTNQFDNPAVRAVIINYRDVTERVEAEQARRLSEEHFAKAFHANPAAMIINRLGDGQVIDANTSYERTMGHARDELLGRKGPVLHLFNHPAERQALAERLRREGFVHDYEATVRTKSGELRSGIFSLELIELQGEPCMLSIFYDITERKGAEEALRESRQRLQALSARLVSAQEDERRILAYELHDEIGQQLTALSIGLELGAHTEGADLHAQVRQAQQGIAALITQVRQLSLNLRPPMIEELGLLPALRWHIERYMQQAKVAVDFKYSELNADLPPHIAIAAYRIVQEGLTNVARHAQTASATVQVWMSAGQLKIAIEDQGAGFDQAAASRLGRSVGLASMRERAELLGGQFALDSTPGEGTRIRVTLPIERAKTV